MISISFSFFPLRYFLCLDKTNIILQITIFYQYFFKHTKMLTRTYEFMLVLNIQKLLQVKWIKVRVTWVKTSRLDYFTRKIVSLSECPKKGEFFIQLKNILYLFVNEFHIIAEIEKTFPLLHLFKSEKLLSMYYFYKFLCNTK